MYIAKDLNGKLRGLLKLKIENAHDDCGNIMPKFKPAKRLKISSLKAEFTSQKLGQRFMRIVFSTAMKEMVNEIYITLFPNSPQRRRLVSMIEQWGFVFYGIKDGREQVLLRSFRKELSDDPKESFPFCSLANNCFIIPINRSYATQLLPPFDNNENIIDVEPIKQAIKKTIIMYDGTPNMKQGSILLFLQKTEDMNVVKITSLGIVEKIYRHFLNESHFISRCRKRSCFLDYTLHDFWIKTSERPIVVDFLYAYHFEKKIKKTVIDNWGINMKLINSQCPVQLSKNQLLKIINNTPYEKIIITHTSGVCKTNT